MECGFAFALTALEVKFSDAMSSRPCLCSRRDREQKGIVFWLDRDVAEVSGHPGATGQALLRLGLWHTMSTLAPPLRTWRFFSLAMMPATSGSSTSRSASG
eukprot:1138213-Pelagomonas_calceolata.AAC.1